MTHGNDSGRGLKTGNTGRKKSTKVKGEGGDEKGKVSRKRTSALKSESETDGQRKYFMASMEKKVKSKRGKRE